MVSDKQARILHVLRILWQYSDEEQPLTATFIMEQLRKEGIVCERKSIYRDLDALLDFGFDLIKTARGTYLATRVFELAELKLLLDAVVSSHSITEKKTWEMIDHLMLLTNGKEQRQLRSQMYVGKRVKMHNETILYNIDSVLKAMDGDWQISFLYCQWNADADLHVKKNGERYYISPWFLHWENEKYYLIGYDESARKMKHFRVDKMLKIASVGKQRQGREEYDAIDVAQYSSRYFSMYQGNICEVKLRCSSQLAGAVIDRFGTEIWMHTVDAQHFDAIVPVAISDKFFGWIAGFCGKVRIAFPQDIQEQYRQWLVHLFELETENL